MLGVDSFGAGEIIGHATIFFHNGIHLLAWSRDHIYDDATGLPQEISRPRPLLKNRVEPQIEEAAVAIALALPAYGQVQ
jgi:hypothetical protein